MLFSQHILLAASLTIGLNLNLVLFITQEDYFNLPTVKSFWVKRSKFNFIPVGTKVFHKSPIEF